MPEPSAAPNHALADVFAALGDPTRLTLVAALADGSALSIASLTRTTDISRQGVTKHLKVLAGAGVVRDVKVGRERQWQLAPASLEQARRTLDTIAREWELALGGCKDVAWIDNGRPV